MAANPLSLKRSEQNGVLYADPVAPDLTVRFRNTTQQKTLNGVNVTNYMCEIIANDNNAVTIDGVAAVDALSVRIRVSGTAESATQLGVILNALAAKIPSWVSEHVFQGFNPTTVPAIPAA